MSAATSQKRIGEPISIKVPEAVRLSGLSRSRLYELMKSGEIEFAKVGSSTLILVDSLRRFICSHRSSRNVAELRPGSDVLEAESTNHDDRRQKPADV